MNKQLRVNFDAIDEENEVAKELFKEDNNEEDNNEEDNNEENNSEILLYKNRLQKLVEDVAISENLIGVQISQEGKERFQEVGEFLISILIFETLEQLRKNSKKKIMPANIDKALDNMINSSSAIDIALELLNKDIEELKILNNSTAINKATNFVNR